jgi:deazaflavin-dependent oxidoreductase (nitroreductase family)
MARPPAAAKQLNKVAVRLAGRRFFPLWAVMHHRGRTSGKEYATPVAVLPVGRTIVIALPWGRGTDWVRNVTATGGCTVTWKGADHECTDPQFVDKGVAIAGTKGLPRFALRRMKLPEGCLQLTLTP